MPSLAELTSEYFEQLTGRSFVITVGSETVELEVANVVMLPPARRRTLAGKEIEMPAKRAPFSVYFRSKGERGLVQGTYAMQPPGGETPLNIFIVPLGIEDGGVTYEAVFT
jgi:hypothetical protein